MSAAPDPPAGGPESAGSAIARLGRDALAARAIGVAMPAAFAVLAATLVAVGALPVAEAAWAALAVAAAFAPSGLVDRSGWRRRAAEAAIVPAAFALTLVSDPTLRRMLVPPLLLLAAVAAAVSALRRTGDAERRALLLGLGLAARFGGGLGLAGLPVPVLVLAVAVPALVAWTAARWRGPSLAVAATVLAGVIPFERHVLVAVTFALAAVAASMLGAPPAGAERVARGWLPAVAGAALVLAAVAPWGGIGAGQAFPAAGWLAVIGLAVTAAAAPMLPAALAGAAWLAATFTLGPAQLAPPDRAQIELTAASPTATLPAGSGGMYIAETSLANASMLRQGTVVAFIEMGRMRLPVRAGFEAAEWAHERADVVGSVRHPLPEHPVWRPAGAGSEAVWAVSGQIVGGVPPGIVPVIRRQPSLPTDVTVTVPTAGPSMPTPPRDWTLPAWLLAAAAVVALLQVLAGTWRSGSAWLPWALLTAGSLLARMPVEPLRLLGERHAVDVAMAALLAAWWPAARVWLARGRIVPAALALLVPLALATPHLTPPVGDEAYHMLLLKSLREDFDLDLSNNYDVVHHPENQIFVTPKGLFLHSPVLAMLLLPGYVLLGRSGAAAMLAGAAALALWLIARRARELGVPESRVKLLLTALLLGYPLATFVTQVWGEVPGIVLACVAMAMASLPTPRPVLASLAAVLSAWIKTRLVLVTMPLAAAAWLPRKWGARTVRNVVLALVLTGTAAIALSIFWFGSALDTVPGRRQASHLIPRNARQIVTSVGGLALDPAGGLAFAAPLALLALAGVPMLWRRGSSTEKALVLGAVLTLFSQLSNREWRGGDSPPARYLVVLLPMAALAGGMLLRSPRRWRPLATMLFVPTLVVWWVFLTRPHLGFNSGDGGFWLGDALARRFSASARHLFPSFLRPGPSTLAWPFIVGGLVAATVWISRRWPAALRVAARCTVALLLVAGAGFAAVVTLRYDRVIELEDPQILAHGGELHPPLGQMSRFAFRNGWRLRNMDAIEVPVSAPGNAALALQGWLEGPATGGARITARWRDGQAVPTRVSGDKDWTITLPPPPSSGRHWLLLTLIAPPDGSVVLDKILVAY
jgi:hypothetical protein